MINYNLIKIILISLILYSCELSKKTSIEFQNKYKNSGFSLIYNDKLTNIKKLDSKISYSNIYALDRLGQNDMVEGRYSLTLGNEYSILDKNKKEIFNLSVANVLRNTHDDDLPIKSTLGNKRSDIIGLLSNLQ